MTDLADKIKQALEAGRSGQYAKKSPYERLGFKRNPFHLEREDPAWEISREDVSLDFAIQLGNAIRLFEQDYDSRFANLLVHGLSGSGKTALARHFDREWERFGFHDYQTLYTALSAWVDPASPQEIATYEVFLDQIERYNKALIIFLDDIDYTITGNPSSPRLPQLIGDIEKRAQYGVIIIGLLNSLTLAALLDNAERQQHFEFFSEFNPDHFFFPVFSNSEIRQLIIARLKTLRRPTDLFSKRSINLLADHSLGLPVVALKLATACLDELIIRDLDKITTEIILDVINRSGYSDAVQLVEAVDPSSDNEIASFLTSKRRDIITSVLNHHFRERFFFPPTGTGLRSSDLAEIHSVGLPTMNYHLKPLVERGFLIAQEDAYDARSKIFTVNWDSPIAHALEIYTVSHRLRQERYHVALETLLHSRRRGQIE